MNIEALTTPIVGTKRPIAALDLTFETSQDATIDLNAPIEPTLEPPTKRPKVAKPTNPNILKTKIRDMKGVILVIFCWDKPFKPKLNAGDTPCDDYKILVYDIENKQVYESKHLRDIDKTSCYNYKYRTEISIDSVLQNNLELDPISSKSPNLPLSCIKYRYYKSLVIKDGHNHLLSHCSLVKSQYTYDIQYNGCGQWSTPETNKIKLETTNDYALYVITEYKKMINAQKNVHKETQKVLNFKL
ncbi:hypothetical protein F-S17_0225 [Faustovirus]|nr:hypothetical protein F-S17_0225 [Faustovirus]QJX74002.1 hypothetical protein F-E9_248 [Faustovirus]